MTLTYTSLYHNEIKLVKHKLYIQNKMNLKISKFFSMCTQTTNMAYQSPDIEY